MPHNDDPRHSTIFQGNQPYLLTYYLLIGPLALWNTVGLQVLYPVASVERTEGMNRTMWAVRSILGDFPWASQKDHCEYAQGRVEKEWHESAPRKSTAGGQPHRKAKPVSSGDSTVGERTLSIIRGAAFQPPRLHFGPHN
jgi:hypothetical protein